MKRHSRLVVGTMAAAASLATSAQAGTIPEGFTPIVNGRTTDGVVTAWHSMCAHFCRFCDWRDPAPLNP